MARVKGVAFLIKCPGCDDGKLRFCGVEIDCTNCNGYGIYIQKASDKEMLRYLEEKK